MRSLTSRNGHDTVQLQTISNTEMSSNTNARICRICSCKCCKANTEDPSNKCHCFFWRAEKEHEEADQHQTVEERFHYRQININEERVLNYWGRCCLWKESTDEIAAKQVSLDQPDLSFMKGITEMNLETFQT
jgi:hypothetical protein